ncbi:MAG TPA: class I SAM-dependent methyltransferase [Anaerolineales bacterium]|nr:class I SAM-dependent methyltransferase [Anaerolineales bacterium]
MSTPNNETPPVCDYEGSTYQATFWDQGGRAYEDGAERVALRRLLPPSGKLMLEVGAGAGRNTPRYKGFERVVVMDYSVTQLEQAQERLGQSEAYVYVAADVYKLPFRPGLFDAATMIRVLHHMAEPQAALHQIRQTLQPDAVFILEFANKLNLKALFRYWLGRQDWSPFELEPVEYIPLNFDFHPKAIRQWLKEEQYVVQRHLTVSHFRINVLKRLVPTRLLVWLDSLAQLTGNLWQLSPSVFVRSQAVGQEPPAANLLDADESEFFICPECRQPLAAPQEDGFTCSCGLRWGKQNGIYNFKQPL